MPAPLLLVLEIHVRPDNSVEILISLDEGEGSYGPVSLAALPEVLDTIAVRRSLPSD